MRRQPSPVAARYLLARLRPLTRPVFWGPSIVLMLVILFTWQYWMRPEWVSYFGANSSSINSRLSSEDRAIGADIDTLPLLFNDFKLPSSPASKPLDLAKLPLDTLSTNLGNLPKIPIPGSSPLTQPQPSNLNGSSNGSSGFSGIMQFGSPANNSISNSGTGRPSGLISTQPQPIGTLLTFPPAGADAYSPRQGGTNVGSLSDQSVTSANNRPPQTPSSFTSSAPAAPIEGTTSLGGFGVNAAPTTNPYANSYTGTTSTTSPYTNSYTSIVGGSQPLSGTVAPSIAPISPSSGQSSLSPQPFSSSSYGSPSLGLQQPQIPVNDAPFTAPRPIPGRVLGGGEINTFSNP